MLKDNPQFEASHLFPAGVDFIEDEDQIDLR